MHIAFLLFDGITALDAVGPYEVLGNIPGAHVSFVAAQAGEKRTMNASSLGLIADRTFDDVTSADVLLVPGGDVRGPRADATTLDWIRSVHETTTWTTSVCTGSLILGEAGLLDGIRATTHWAAMDTLRGLGAEPVSERVVTDGKIVTAAGVSSGIDMALTLTAKMLGAETAQTLQLAIEYDPQPPFDSGSPDKAPPGAVELLRATLSDVS